MGDSMIRLEGIKKAYGKHEVLKGVNMQINKGDIYGLIGRNGAGKTTIFKMILGLSRPNEGEVSIENSKTEKELMAARSRVGFLVGTHFYKNMSARDNLEYFASVKGIKHSEINNEITRVLDIVGLKDDKKPAKNFSLGMGQRLGIGVALLGSPDILILDEPTNGLDPQGISDIRNMVKRFRDEFGMTVIVSSHILGELEHTADRFGIVNEGIVVKEIDQDDLKEKRRAVEIEVDDLEKARKILKENDVNILREIEERTTLEDYYFRLVGGDKR